MIGNLRHVLFERAQVVQITPKEVVSAAQIGNRYASADRAAMFDLGRSRWLQSFSPTHLERCRHVQMLFYDQLVDVICEGIACGRGSAPMA
jgi:hypothetical protein